MSLSIEFRKISEKPDTPLGPHGGTALHLAAQEGNIAVAHEAIEAGARYYIPDQAHNTSLIYAALKGDAAMAELDRKSVV